MEKDMELLENESIIFPRNYRQYRISEKIQSAIAIVLLKFSKN